MYKLSKFIILKFALIRLRLKNKIRGYDGFKIQNQEKIKEAIMHAVFYFNL